jgi:hypothetical protein
MIFSAVRQWPLQRLGFVPRPAHPNVRSSSVVGITGIALRLIAISRGPVCDRWRSFPSFCANVGKRPSWRHLLVHARRV